MKFLLFLAEESKPIRAKPAHVLRRVAMFTLVIATTLTACSLERIHATGQAWQRQQCIKRMDTQDRDRCLKEAGTSNEAYKRQAEDARTGQ